MTKAPDLRRLRYFVAVAETGGFRLAADRIGIAQPPLSQQIMALEKELGQQLFMRHARSIELTDAGRALLAEAVPLLERADAIPLRVRRAAEGAQGMLCIGFTSATSFHPFLPQLLRAYRRNAPGVAVSFVEDETVSLCDRVAEGRVAAAIIRPPAPARERLIVKPLLDESVMAAVPRDHPLAERRALALTELAAEDLVLFERALAPGLYDAILAACVAAGFSPQIAHHAPQKTSALMLAAGGAGIALVPGSLTGIHADDLVMVPLAGAQPIAPMAIAMREREPSIRVQRFVRLACDEAAKWRTPPDIDAHIAESSQ